MKSQITKQEIQQAFAVIKNDLCENYSNTAEGCKVIAETYSQNEVMKVLYKAAINEQINPVLVKIHVLAHCRIDDSLPIFPDLVEGHKALVEKIMSM